MQDNIAILIIFFNKPAQTIECIESFLPAGQHIYVLNNASDEASWQMLQEKYRDDKRISLYHSAENLGPAKGRNLLLEKCTGDWIFLVDNDITIKPVQGWKQLFDKAVEVQRDAAIFCPAVFNVHENSFAQPHHFTKQDGVVQMEPATEAVTNYFSCCGVIIHRKIFEQYGNFDNELFAFEDYEFSIRALCSPMGEFKVHPLPEIELIHDHRYQPEKKDQQAVRERYNEEKIRASMQRLMDKHGIVFEHNWEWWTRKQVADMTSKSLYEKIKQGLTRRMGLSKML